MSFVEQYLLQLNTEKRRWRCAVAILTALSLIVALTTVWNLRMTGVTSANNATCEYEEHMHAEECMENDSLICGLEEHIHNTGCYSDPTADVETMLDWQNMLYDYPLTGDLRADLVGIAKTQVGYTESSLNYEANADGTRRGYTRYGDWYGAPYNDWSAIFVSFCLSYAGADTSEYPMLSGAASMAELWKLQEKFVPVGEYTPQSGDIVFFNDNTAGIIAEVYNATFYAICGDMQDAVRTVIVSLGDASIMGWGITGEKAENTETEEEEQEDILDISNGPSVHIFEGSTESVEIPFARGYSLRMARTITDLLPYLDANGGGYFFTLLDNNNMELPKDEQGNYIAQANTVYKLTTTFTSPEGFAPGTYQYQVPNGLMVGGGSGNFTLKDGTNVGTWEVTDTGLITMVFNENINNHSDITISVTLGINFPEQRDPIDFDGKITVSVEKPPQQQYPTQLYKWGQQGNADGGQDSSKLYWTLQIVGNKDSQIPGNILSDKVLDGEWSKDHHYTESDIAGGLTFGVSEPDPVTGEFKDWHSWHIPADDPHLVWTETGWSYKMPLSATCQWCGEVILGNENWIYTVNYTSTPYPAGAPGTYGYENEASIDGQYAYAWTDFTHGEVYGEITKVGSFVSDAEGGNFVWEFQAVIPPRKQDQVADYHWYIMDYMYLLDNEWNRAGHIYNDANLAYVTAFYNGTTVVVPEIKDATENDLFAWENAWTANNNGVDYGREINLLCRCQCNENNCRFWNGQCGKYWYIDHNGEWATNGFCQCWTPEETVTLTFVYKTDALDVVGDYGGLGYMLQNVAELHFKPTGTDEGALVSSDSVVVDIPGVFKKELTHDFNGYTAHYKITVNEAKAVLTNGTPLTIHDAMTDTLAYISGSLIITAEDANGQLRTLKQGEDFTVTYDGTGDQKDEAGNKVHVLEIVILKPQPVMYILDYDTTLIMPEQVTGGIKYKNSASVTLWGEEVIDPGVGKVYADINIATKSYKVGVYKTCALTNKSLSGATFGLYNAQGGLITTGITNADGTIFFQTNVVQGIILREHVLYYLKEINAPVAYRTDDTQYWFCFCSDSGAACVTCNQVMAGLSGTRIPFDQAGVINVVNYPVSVQLPQTGGMGTTIYILCGLSLVVCPFVYGFRLKRRHGRRSKQ